MKVYRSLKNSKPNKARGADWVLLLNFIKFYPLAVSLKCLSQNVMSLGLEISNNVPIPQKANVHCIRNYLRQIALIYCAMNVF